MVAVRASQERTLGYYTKLAGVTYFTFSAISLRFGENFQSPRAHSGPRLSAGRCDRGRSNFKSGKAEIVKSLKKSII